MEKVPFYKRNGFVVLAFWVVLVAILLVVKFVFM